MNAIKPPLWTKDFILMTFTNLFMSAGSFLLIPVLPIYAREVFDASESEIGYIIGIYTLSALFLRPVVGVALDTIGRKPTYLVGLVLFVVFMPFYAWASSLLLLFAIRFLHGLTWGAVTTGGSTIASDIVPMERRGEGIGYFGMSFTVAMAIGPVLGLGLVQHVDYQSLFYIASLVVAATFVIATFVKYPQIVNAKRARRGLSLDMIVDQRVLPASTIALFCSGVYGGLISFITLFMEESGIQTGIALLDSGAVFFVAYAIGLTSIRPIAGVQMDRHGPARVMGFGFVVLMISVLALASTREIISFFIASLTAGIGMGVILPTTITMVVNLVEPERRGVANSTFFSAVDIGVGLGTILLGMIASATSVTFMYYVCGGIVAIPLLLFFTFVLKDYNQKLAKIREELQMRV